MWWTWSDLSCALPRISMMAKLFVTAKMQKISDIVFGRCELNFFMIDEDVSMSTPSSVLVMVQCSGRFPSAELNMPLSFACYNDTFGIEWKTSA